MTIKMYIPIVGGFCVLSRVWTLCIYIALKKLDQTLKNIFYQAFGLYDSKQWYWFNKQIDIENKYTRGKAYLKSNMQLF